MCDKGALSLGAYQDFYAKRVKHLEDFKRHFGKGTRFPDDPTLDTAMTELKSSMVTLIEQDVTLMRQLLSVKDAIEDLKTEYYSRSPSPLKSPLSSPSPLRIPIKGRVKGHAIFSSPPSPLSPSRVEPIHRPRSILISLDSPPDHDLCPPSPREPMKSRVKGQRSLTHDSYDSNSSGFASQASSPTSMDVPTRPPRSKGQRSRNHGHQVELILTEPDEVCV